MAVVFVEVESLHRTKDFTDALEDFASLVSNLLDVQRSEMVLCHHGEIEQLRRLTVDNEGVWIDGVTWFEAAVGVVVFLLLLYCRRKDLDPTLSLSGEHNVLRNV